MPYDLIHQRRTQMLVHSYLYYGLGTSIVTDHDWQRWADELVELQRAHPGGIGFYDQEFVDWDGSTGMHLPNDGWVVGVATHLLGLHDRPGGPPVTPGPGPLPLAAVRAASTPTQASLF